MSPRKLKEQLSSLAAAAAPDADLAALKHLVNAAFGKPDDTSFVSDLFDTLELIQADAADAPWLRMVCAAAALHVLPAHGHKILAQFLDAFFVPLVCSTHLPSSAAYTQVAGDICSLMAAQGAWPQLHQLLSRATDALSAGLQQSSTAASPASSSLPPMPLHASSCLIACGLSACCKAVEAKSAGQASAGSSTAGRPAVSGQGPEVLLQAAVGQLLPVALRMLGCAEEGGDAIRRAALRSVLPAVVACAMCQGPAAVDQVAAALWSQCVSMLRAGSTPRRTALAALVQFVPLLHDHPVTTISHADGDAFWEQLRACLAGSDPLDRKRAAHVLQQLVPPAHLRTPAWSVWLMLHSLLEEFGTHLIHPAWPQISTLHTAAPEFADTQMAVHMSAPRKKLRPRRAGKKIGKGQEVREASEETAEASDADHGPDVRRMPWLCVLWERALCHPNLQVQRLGLRSFLQRAWGSAGSLGDARQHSEVPAALVADVLLPAIVRDVHYKGVQTDMDVQERVCAWLAAWLASADAAGQRTVLHAAITVLGSKDVPRLGIQAGMHAVGAAASSAAQLGLSDGAGTWAQQQLVALRTLAASISWHQGTAFKAELYGHLLRIAAVAAPVSLVGLSAAMGLVLDVPSAATVLGGALNGLTRAYLLGAEAGASGQQGDAVAAGLEALAAPLLKASKPSSGSSGSSTEAVDVPAAQAVAAPIGRLLVVCGDLPEVAALNGVLARVARELAAAYLRPHTPMHEVTRQLVCVCCMAEAMLPYAGVWAATTPALRAMLALAAQVCDSVAALASACVCALHPSDAALAAAAQLREGGSVNGQGLSSADAIMLLQRSIAQDAARAELALQCAGLLVQLLAHVRVGSSSGAVAGGSSASQLDVLAGPLMQLLKSFVSKAPTKHAATGMPPASAPGTSNVAAAREGVRLQRLHAVRGTCASLAAASKHSQDLAGMVARGLDMQGAVEAVLQECAAAQTHSTLLVAAARGAAAAAIEAEQWACIDAIMTGAFAAHKHAPDAAARRSPLISFGDLFIGAGKADGKASPSSQPRGSQPRLDTATLAAVLSGSLDVVRYCGDDEILAALRCVRRAWSQSLVDAADNELQEGLAAALGVVRTPGRSALADVAWVVLRAVCSSLAGGGGNSASIAKLKKKAALCAALANTILVPQLFDFAPGTPLGSVGTGGAVAAAGAAVAEGLDALSTALGALHGEGGPVAWAIDRVVDWGASAPRVVLMLCCQLASLMVAAPGLIAAYAPQLQRLLLYGSPRPEGAVRTYEVEGELGGGVAPATTSGPQAEELGLVAAPIDAALVGGYAAAGSDVAPRAALLAGVHAVAQAAGCVWQPEGGDDIWTSIPAEYHAPDNTAAMSHAPAAAPVTTLVSGTIKPPAACMVGAAVDASDGRSSMPGGCARVGPSGAQPQSSPPRTRPIIVFGDSWQEESSPLPAPPQRGNLLPAAAPLPSDAASTSQGPATSAPTSSSAAASNPLQAGLAALGRLSGQLPPVAAAAAQPVAGLASGGQGTGAFAPASSGAAAKAAASRPAAPLTPYAQAARSAGRVLWDRLLHMALHDPNMTTDKFKFGSELHRQKVRLWQALGVLTSFVDASSSTSSISSSGSAVAGEDLQKTVRAVLATFSLNEAPSVKQYQEAVAAALLLKQPSLVEAVLLPQITEYGKSHAGLGSLILLAGQVVLHAGPVWRPRLMPPLLLAMSPWVTCHTHSARTFAQLIMHALLTVFPPGSPVWGHSAGDVVYLSHLMAFFTTNHDLTRLRRTIGAPILAWRPSNLASPRRLMGHPGVSLAGQPPDNIAFEGVRATLADRIAAFLVAERYRLREEITDRMADIELGPEGQEQAAGEAATSTQDFQRKVLPSHQAALVRGSVPGLASLQTNNGANASAADGDGGEGEDGEGLWGSFLASGLAGLLDMAESAAAEMAHATLAEPDGGGRIVSDELRGVVRAGSGRQDIIICATLVDKLPNLAGLARTAEVFRAAALVLPDAAMAAEPAFSSISVTAERWVPCVEVREAALLGWLARQRAAGYTLLGLEQTAESHVLPAYPFPARCVLVLGREKEGMPAEVMQLLDATVEIPQLGLIRSLNVHVSGAIALYEYTRQHHLGLPPAVLPVGRA